MKPDFQKGDLKRTLQSELVFARTKVLTLICNKGLNCKWNLQTAGWKVSLVGQIVDLQLLEI